ncbi:MAG: hypothetical protein B7X34_09550 [Acidobacteriia bacterium 12-62-4]|nr:MAG: hypothetical protein B7X34_09550 [Acidobacteriia bacterium 12-62-4]
MSCPRCRSRKAKRHCPALQLDICPQCCGTEREETIACPLDCAYLRDARQHEKLVPMTAAESPYPGEEITERFLLLHQTQLILLTNALFVAAVAEEHADADVRTALDELINGSPAHPIAVAFSNRLAEVLAGLTPEAQTRFWSDDALRKLQIFLLRLAVGRDNGRSRGRAFVSFLEDHFNRTMGGR